MTEASAVPLLHDFAAVSIHADHIQMTRFRSERDAGYDLVRGTLRRTLVEAKIDVEPVEPVVTSVRLEPAPV